MNSAEFGEKWDLGSSLKHSRIDTPRSGVECGDSKRGDTVSGWILWMVIPLMRKMDKWVTVSSL